jgi:hypothetical protein
MSVCSYRQATLDTLRSLRLDDSYRAIVAHGVHAGFPVCCIYFYARIWVRWGGPVPELYEASNHDPDTETRRHLWERHPEFMRAVDEKFSYLAEDSSWDVGYVRCPACVVKDHRVVVRLVDDYTCGCWAANACARAFTRGS